MNRDEVPQDGAKAYMGMKKALYAVDADGRYRVVGSSGWEAEEIVLEQAIEEFEALSKAALERGRAGVTSPLEFHMYRRRMDVVLLAQSTGFFRWSVKRHLRPAVFASLSAAKKQRYADALGLSIAELERLPD
jgi:hypothetical protein